jgi:hypothetical protein
MRKDITELMRVCERLIGFARQENELTNDECDAIVYYIRELENEVLPYCKQHHQPSPQSCEGTSP